MTLNLANKPVRVCEDCGQLKPHQAHGLCSTCYRRDRDRIIVPLVGPPIKGVVDKWAGTEVDPRKADPDPRWRADANCRGVDTNLFFPERGESTSDAKAVCAGCPAREACAEYALAAEEKFGIWGGLSERERRVLRKTRKAAS